MKNIVVLKLSIAVPSVSRCENRARAFDCSMRGGMDSKRSGCSVGKGVIRGLQIGKKSMGQGKDVFTNVMLSGNV